MNHRAPYLPIRQVRRRFIDIALTAGSIVLIVGCSSGGDAAGPPRPSATATPTPCPGAALPSKVGAWPAPVPADLPKPPSGTRARVIQSNGVLTIVSFSTQASLRDAVLFVLRDF